eukprot:3293497-Pleurochrysis_carterae.AAC.3
MAIERARRCVSRVFNEELHALALSDVRTPLARNPPPRPRSPCLPFADKSCQLCLCPVWRWPHLPLALLPSRFTILVFPSARRVVCAYSGRAFLVVRRCISVLNVGIAPPRLRVHDSPLHADATATMHVQALGARLFAPRAASVAVSFVQATLTRLQPVADDLTQARSGHARSRSTVSTVLAWHLPFKHNFQVDSRCRLPIRVSKLQFYCLRCLRRGPLIHDFCSSIGKLFLSSDFALHRLTVPRDRSATD